MASPFGSGSGVGSGSGFGSAPLFGTFGSKPIPSSQVSSKESHSKSFMGSIARLFNDAKYSDATIRIRNVTLPVHKCVICIQSPYFENAFKENMAEGISGELTFGEGSGAAYWRVFEYLYTGDYSESLPTNGLQDDPTLLKDPLVYALADMFFLEHLKALSERKLEDKLKSDWTSDDFPDCIRKVYEFTYNVNSNMRSIVVKVAVAHARELSKKETFTDLLKDGGDFAVEYTDALIKRMNIN